jgi:hypothetical protein
VLKDYGPIPDADEFPDSQTPPSLADATHVDLDRLVILLFEGKELTSETNEHLSKCMQCRHAMVDAASKELWQWRDPGLCQARKSLFREWRDAVEMYIVALAELTGQAGKIPASELFRIATIVEITRRLTAQVRAELDEHIATHKC